MAERPILFQGDMVRALLAGTKTQTRRALRIQPPPGVRVGFVPGETKQPYGWPGDRLWVREAWRLMGNSPEDTLDMFDRDDVQYRADDDQSYIDKYRPSIHMPRRFSRITLEVTEVRMQRVQSISEEDARAEGVALHPDGKFTNYLSPTGYATNAISSYRTLWDAINGDRPGLAWADNPWVWAVSFKVVSAPGVPATRRASPGACPRLLAT